MNRRRLLIFGGSAVALAFVAAFAVWWFVLRSDAPDPVSLEEAVGAVTSEAAGSTAPDETTTSSTTAAFDISGQWATVPGNGSFAGYRVDEELGGIGFNTAAGRTEDLSGSLQIADGVVTSVQVTVDLQTLTSDDDRRDRAIRTQALETDFFPTGSFTLLDPIELPEGAAAGEPFTVTAIGELELHGVVNQLGFTIEAQLVENVVVVVGSTEILFSDYGIEQPRAPVLLSVEDHGEMEFQLLFEMAG